jgi:hypothetical protein
VRGKGRLHSLELIYHIGHETFTHGVNGSELCRVDVNSIRLFRHQLTLVVQRQRVFPAIVQDPQPVHVLDKVAQIEPALRMRINLRNQVVDVLAENAAGYAISWDSLPCIAETLQWLRLH